MNDADYLGREDKGSMGRPSRARRFARRHPDLAAIFVTHAKQHGVAAWNWRVTNGVWRCRFCDWSPA